MVRAVGAAVHLVELIDDLGSGRAALPKMEASIQQATRTNGDVHELPFGIRSEIGRKGPIELDDRPAIFGACVTEDLFRSQQRCSTLPRGGDEFPTPAGL